MLVHSSTIAPISRCCATSASPASRMSRSAAAASSACLVVEHDAGELAAVVGADDRCRRIGAGGDHVLGGQARGADRQDADPLAGRQDALDERDLHQARGRDRHADMRGDLALIERQKPAGRGDAVGAELHELGGGVEKRVDAALAICRDDAVAAWRPARPCRAPETARSSPFPMSPGMRGNRVSSIRMPTRAP